MNAITISARGERTEAFVEVLAGKLKEKYQDLFAFSSGNLTVFAVEAYYFRVDSNLLTFIVLDGSQQGQIGAQVVSGGGSSGLLGITWGAETDSTKQVAETIQSVCSELSLTFEVGISAK